METTYNEFKRMKKVHPKAVLLFRDGENYQAFNEDADLLGTIGAYVSKLAYGRRHAAFQKSELDKILRYIVRTGRRVAICEPLPRPTDGM